MFLLVASKSTNYELGSRNKKPPLRAARLYLDFVTTLGESRQLAIDRAITCFWMTLLHQFTDFSDPCWTDIDH